MDCRNGHASASRQILEPPSASNALSLRLDPQRHGDGSSQRLSLG
jgi:hypothetical protein